MEGRNGQAALLCLASLCELCVKLSLVHAKPAKQSKDRKGSWSLIQALASALETKRHPDLNREHVRA
jgi:hypothetical protein